VGGINPCRNTGGEASILAGIQEGKPQSLPELRREASILAGTQEGSLTRTSPPHHLIIRRPCRDHGKKVVLPLDPEIDKEGFAINDAHLYTLIKLI
jgi:hypothetical protein